MSFDVIVVGLGIMGSAACAALARRGRRVLGLDAFEPHHTRGSSHGTSRAIRKAYFQSREYVPLVERAYPLWRQLEQESGAELLRVTGSLLVGSPESDHIAGTLASATRFGLACEQLGPGELGERFPGFRLHGDLTAVFEPSGGILHAERCLAAFRQVAEGSGAALQFSDPVRQWAPEGGGVRVQTDQASYVAERLIVTVGPWAGQVLADLRLPLTVRRVVNVYVQPTRRDLFAPETCPTFAMALPEGEFYGMLEGDLKIGRGDVGDICTPDSVRRAVDADEVAQFRTVLERYLPGANGPMTSAMTCLYTLTPDRDFIVDTHPLDERVAYACGFSGHGFKFAPVIGEVLADLAIDGRTSAPVAFLSASRLPSVGASHGSPA